jgi:hypothetical protein
MQQVTQITHTHSIDLFFVLLSWSTTCSKSLKLLLNPSTFSLFCYLGLHLCNSMHQASSCLVPVAISTYKNEKIYLNTCSRKSLSLSSLHQLVLCFVILVFICVPVCIMTASICSSTHSVHQDITLATRRHF